MSDNSWYENRNTPPVGTKCIADFTGNDNSFLRSIGKVECEIVMHSLCSEGEFETAVFRWQPDGKAYRYHAVVGDSRAFRPIKTERELAIEAAMESICHLVGSAILRNDIACSLFEDGLLRPKNES